MYNYLETAVALHVLVNASQSSSKVGGEFFCVALNTVAILLIGFW